MKIFSIITGIVFALLLTASFVIPETYVVKISEQESEQIINKLLPLEVKKFAATAYINELKIDFKKDNTVEVFANYDLKGMSFEGEGRTHLKSSVDFRSNSFYLADFTVVDHSHEIKDKERVDAVKQAAQGMWNKLKTKVTTDEDVVAKQAFDKLKGDAIPRIQSYIAEQVQMQIENTPLYTLKGFQAVMGDGLKEIRFEENVASVELNVIDMIASFFVRVVLTILLSVSFAVAFFRNR